MSKAKKLFNRAGAKSEVNLCKLNAEPQKSCARGKSLIIVLIEVQGQLSTLCGEEKKYKQNGRDAEKIFSQRIALFDTFMMVFENEFLFRINCNNKKSRKVICTD